MNISNNSLNLLSANAFKGVGSGWINSNLIGKNEDEILGLLSKQQKKEISNFDFEEIKENILKNIKNLGEFCDGVISINDKFFPTIKGNVKISDRPFCIFYKGNLELLEYQNAAVIGLLKPDERIEKIEKMVVKEIANHAGIISGLAFGCDAIAHKSALEFGAPTIAILPSPLNDILPKRNQRLAYEIVENGLTSEYYLQPSTQYELVNRYILRDRLQALFSDCVILSASYAPNAQKLDSGSRHAMNKAREYGIKRAVIYDEIFANDPQFDLNRQIIQNDKNAIILNSNNLKSSVKKLFAKDSLF